MSSLSVEVARARTAGGVDLVAVEVVTDRTRTTFQLSTDYALAVADALRSAATGLTIASEVPANGNKP